MVCLLRGSCGCKNQLELCSLPGERVDQNGQLMGFKGAIHVCLGALGCCCSNHKLQSLEKFHILSLSVKC